jgi:molecular chaperone GrpE (heat shock protein)
VDVLLSTEIENVYIQLHKEQFYNHLLKEKITTLGIIGSSFNISIHSAL